MNKYLTISAIILTGSTLFGCFRQSDAGTAENNRYAAMARETLDSMYAKYSIPGENLLRENYPSDEAYAATYLAEAPVETFNAYSYLWPYSGSFSAVNALYSATGDTTCIEVLQKRILPGLEMYLDTARQPAAYASYVNTAPQSDRFYDDNVWLGIDFTDMYLATKDPKYLDKARMIWEFIESSTDSILGGGIYWCEQKKGGKNTCSNAPGSVYALKLYEATADRRFLDKGRELYTWTKNNLQDTTDCLYFDNINLKGEIGRAKFAYNSGQMMQSAALLFKATGDSVYLNDARSIAESAHRHFFNGGEANDSIGAFPLLGKGNVWFTAVMMRGFEELFNTDRNPEYMDHFVRNLDHAWLKSRDAETGLFNQDWSGTETDTRKWLLTQAAMAEMYSRAATYINNTKNN